MDRDIDHRTDRPGVVDRLVAATNAHDLAALTACFAEDYVLTDRVHPARGFTGREQVHRNWTQLFGAVPDLSCEVRDRVERADAEQATVWLELAMAGRRLDGAPHAMAGVLIFTVERDLIRSGRFYLEVVDRSEGDADSAVRAVVGGRA